MVSNLYSVYDLKGKFFSPPFVAQNHDLAKRSFGEAVNDTRTTLNKYPSEFQLFCLGYFNDANGEIALEEHTVIELIAVGSEFVKKS